MKNKINNIKIKLSKLKNKWKNKKNKYKEQGQLKDKNNLINNNLKDLKFHLLKSVFLLLIGHIIIKYVIITVIRMIHQEIRI